MASTSSSVLMLCLNPSGTILNNAGVFFPKKKLFGSDSVSENMHNRYTATVIVVTTQVLIA